MERLEEIIAKERPDALLPNLGGQSGLNLCAELNKAGILDKYNVKVIGVQVDAIERGEDRIEFKHAMDKLGIEMARSEVAYSVEEALAIADKLDYPVVLRPAYTMGGAGGGLVYNKEELKTVCARGLQASLVGRVLVEEYILGWEELELEVVRDKDNNMITVCFIENIDPLGVHTGDSFCAAPMLTISEECQKRLQEQAYKIVESVEVIGGTNVQFAHDPVTDRIIVIEINPRTSRSSALASKATGFPIALVSAMLATGLTLKDIPCGKYGTLDKYVPDGDYVVIKFARWAFEKFKGVEDKLGTQMRAVGEVMSIGKNYKEAFQKAIRSLETGRYGLGHAKNYDTITKEELLHLLINPTSDRHFIMYEAIRKGATTEEIFDLTKVKTYFIEQMRELVEEEEEILKSYRREEVEKNSQHTNKKADKIQKTLPIYISCEEKSTALALYKREGIQGMYLNGDAMEACLDEGVSRGMEMYLSLPHIMRGEFPENLLAQIDNWLDRGMTGFLVRNLETFAILKKAGLAEKCVLDHSMYTWNDEAVDFWIGQHVMRNTVPLELNEGEIRHRDNQNSEMLIYGYLPLMISAQCVHKNVYGCNHKEEWVTMKDRYDKEFTAKCVCNPWKMENTNSRIPCYNIIYNSIPYGLLKEKSQIDRLGVSSLRLAFTIEKPQDAVKIYEEFRDVYLNEKNPPKRDYTKGHFKRGAE